MKKLSPKPRKYTHDGIERYCAPACGYHCTRSAYETAQTTAKEVALELGPGWKPIIWENLGWWARVERGNAHIYILPDKFWCSMIIDGRQWHAAEGRTAKAAYTRVIQGLRRHITELERELRTHDHGGKENE